MRLPLTHVRAGRYRTRTAAEATAACGGNREPRLGQRSDFSKPCQGAAEKSANATRTGASRQIPSRFPTRRNVYQERCRQTIRSGDFLWWTAQDSNSTKGMGSPDRVTPCLLFEIKTFLSVCPIKFMHPLLRRSAQKSARRRRHICRQHKPRLCLRPRGRAVLPAHSAG